jgi:hypothetical protein
MYDIESPMQDKSLRYRKHNVISQNQKLVRRFNKANDEDPDEDETSKAIRKVFSQKQKEANENMTNQIMNLLSIVFVIFILINIYLSVGVSERNQNSPLIKALRILVGKRQSKPFLPAGTTFATVTSLSKNLVNEFMYPSWPWSKSSSQFLMPKEAIGNTPVGKILRQIMRYKSDLGAETLLLTNDDIEAFLSGVNGQKCNSIQSNSFTLLQRYQEFGRYGMKDGQRMLVTWCLLYSGQAYAVMDIDRYDVIIRYKYVQDMKKGLVKNAFVGFDKFETRTIGDTSSLATSLIIIQNPAESSVPEGMLKYLSEVDVQSSKEFEQAVNEKMIELIGNESSNWTRLLVNCEELVPSSSMKICQSNRCCDLSYSAF